MTIWADLHCHSSCSDGSLTPSELIDTAASLGLKGVSITDHDTMEGYETAIAAAQRRGIRLGSGVEFSCHFERFNIHILGYDFNLLDSGLINLCLRHRTRRKERNLAILEKLEKLQFPIDYSEAEAKAQGKVIGRPHIAEVMVEKGYVQNIREAFHLYIGEGKSCYVQGEPFKIQEAIDLLHAAHGKAFIAHPQLLPKDLALDEFLKLPFDGIECYYSGLSSKKWVEVARQKQWLMSGGSDFHGAVKPDVALGRNGVSQEMFESIFEHPLT